MKLDPDVLVDRMRLKSRLRKWQMVAVGVILVSLLILVNVNVVNNPNMKKAGEDFKKMHQDYIARVSLDGIIMDDDYRSQTLKDIAEDKHAKAVIFNIDSPGGTTVGGESLYEEIRNISKAGKPVVIVQHTLAASAAYMASIAGDRIYARQGTVTGSIGVLAQTGEITDLASKLGIKFETFKSAPLKASPSPFEKTTPEAAAAMQSVIDDFYHFFIDLVAERRGMTKEKATQLSDGRVYTGRQALANGLIDAIGGEDEAKEWLYKEKNISRKIEIEDIDIVEPEKTLADKFFGRADRSQLYQRLNLSGLLAIWQP